MLDEENGDRDSIGVGNQSNGVFYFPGYFYSTVFKQPAFRIERLEYTQKSTAAGFAPKYFRTYANNLSIMPEELRDQQALIAPALNTVYTEFISDMIMNGVTNVKWDNFLKELVNADVHTWEANMQKALDAYFTANPVK